MKTSRRRTVFQLTPLLDLLLIVIFAQFLGVQVVSSESASELRQSRSEFEQEMDAERTKLSQLQSELDDQKQRQDRAISSLLEQQRIAGEQLLGILQPATESNLPLSDQLKTIREDLLQNDGQEFVEFLVRYSEMSKRCDVWELYVTEEGTIEFDNGQRIERASAKTVDEISDVVFDTYKTFPEPKTLVIILFSFGDILDPTYDAFEAALPKAITRMRNDAGGRRWFELAELGYLPEGPSLRKADDREKRE